MPKLTVITGASSDIGLALTSHLLATTDRTIVAHSFSGSDRLAAVREQYGDRILRLQADLSDIAAVPAFADSILELGEVAAFVHLPALRPGNERFPKMNWEFFERDLTVQLRSAMILLQRFLPKMSKQEHSRIVFMLSSYVHGIPPKYTAMYTIVKYAQLGLMRSLAAEYAATKVRINAISPSMVDTRFLGGIAEVAVQMTAESNPQGRNAVPADLLGVFDLLLSPTSDYMTGIDIPVAAGTVN